MGRVLQCLVCITAMLSSVLSQRSYYQHSSQIAYSANPYEVPQARNLQYSHPITVNFYTRTQEARKHKLERIQEPPRIENGTNYSQISKRGTLEKYGAELNDRVVFPGPTSNEAERQKKPEGPQLTEECRRRGFCVGNEVRDYPYEEVNSLVANIPEELRKTFQMDVPDDDIQIAQRLGGSSEQEIPLCTINETVFYPKSLPDKDGKWWYVLNQDGKPLQGFLAELCKTENTSCNPVANFQDGYKGTCKQKYVYRMVEALNDDQKSHSPRLLRLPGCCSCVVTTVNPFSR